MSEEPIDFSPLNSPADLRRWDAVMARTMGRVDLTLRSVEPQPPSPLLIISEWVKPILAAAAIALLILVPAEFALELREQRREQVERLVRLTNALSHDRQPTASDFVRVLTERSRP